MSTTNRISARVRSESANASGHEFSSNLGRALFQHRIEAVLLATKNSTHADGLAVSLKEDAGFVCRASVGLAPEIGVVVEQGQGICGRCIAEATAVVEQALEGEIKSVAAVPVMKDGEVFGFVAGFSMEQNAFPPMTLADLHALAETIHNEIEPPIAIELKPEEAEEEHDLLSHFGITATPKPEANEQQSAEEDESFLSELVRDVLENAPSNVSVTEPVKPAEPEPAKPQRQEPQQTDAPNFPPRTTEEVLMQVMDHHAPAGQGSAAAAAAPAPAPATAATPSAASVTIPARPAEPKIDKTQKQKQKAKSGWKPVQVPETRVEAAPEPIAVVEEEAPKEADAKSFDFRKLAADPKYRIAALVIIGVMLISAVTYTMYFRKRGTQEPQKVLASAPSTTAAAPEAAPATSGNTPTTTEIKKDGARETRPNSERSARPLIVASTSPAKKVATEESPSFTFAGTPKISAPELPTRSSDVVFGGVRSTGATPARLLQRVDPVVPSIARSMHLSGDVRMEALVGADGRIKSVRTLEGPNMLAVAAGDAIRKWRYQPAQQNGKNVESTVEVTIRFR